MPEQLIPNTKACKSCTIGSCCYEGTELTKEEILRIVKFNPPVAKPWFRRLEDHEQSDDIHAFSTVVRNGTCVFQGKDNRCVVYPARPHYCREFPEEGRGTATYYQHLCVLFHEEWSAKSAMKRNLLKRDGPRLDKEPNLLELKEK